MYKKKQRSLAELCRKQDSVLALRRKSDSILIFSDDVLVQNSNKTYVPFRNTFSFWEHCSEDDIKIPSGRGRMDPLLNLYLGCRIMLPCNTSVREGQANGTWASLEKVILKSGELPQQVLLGNVVP